jgi:MoxR-like ATPase
MDEKIEQYILDIIFSTREPSNFNMSDLALLINYGGSPRASINLALASKAYAFITGEAFVTPEHVRHVCKDVLRHRIGLSYEAEAENITQEDVIDRILNTVIVP